MKILTRSDEIAVCRNCISHLDRLVQDKLVTQEDVTTLRNPFRIIHVNFPVTMDNGATKLISGFRVQYNDTLGPTKGGIRMHEESDVEEVSELAFLMTLKTSLAGLPYGGAKGAIRVNPKTCSPEERERIVRGYTKAVYTVIGPEVDIPAPDVNTGAEEMAWIRDQYETCVGHDAPAVVTGKSLDNGGSLGRETSTSLGGFYILLKHLENHATKPFEETRVAIQGFGNVGGHLAEFLHEKGFKVVAVSDSKTGIYNADGLPIPELVEYKKKRGAFVDRAEEKVSNEKLLELPVDILIPAALGEIITAENAPNIHAKLILEMANAPITPEADELLEKQDVVVIPDILANAGGVIVSYFEWVQNRADEKWDIDTVNKKLKEHILAPYEKMMRVSDERNISLRNAAYSVALERILGKK